MRTQARSAVSSACPGCLVELPLTTTLMLRSIADIARAQGERLDDPATTLACLEVLAHGGCSARDDGSESGYFAVRTAKPRCGTPTRRCRRRRKPAQPHRFPPLRSSPARVRLAYTLSRQIDPGSEAKLHAGDGMGHAFVIATHWPPLPRSGTVAAGAAACQRGAAAAFVSTQGPAMKTRSRSETDDDQPRLAVLIDADNAQPSVIEGLLAEVAKYGVASVKRIYGDFTSTRMTQWKQALLKHSISPVQQFAYTSGKNATDSSLIIDAMDLLYTGRFDGFCLVSSDSDFTRLAQRLREEGPTVYGFGERKTPDAFVQACDKFIYTEVLRSEAASSEPSKPAAAAAKPARKGRKTPHVAQAAQTAKPEATAAVAATTVAPAMLTDAKAAPLSAPLKLLRQAIEEASDDQGWAGLGSVGSYLNKVRPDFDPRLYGHKKLSDLLRRLSAQFELEERGNEGSGKRIFVRSRS